MAQVANQPFNYSSFVGLADIAKPIWSTKLYDPYGKVDQQLMLLMNRSKERAGNITGVHYEQDRPTTYFRAGAIGVVSGANNLQTLPLDASLVNADGSSAVAVGDLLKLSTGTMPVFRVDSVSGANPPVVTLVPLRTGYNTPIASGSNLAYIGRTEKERSSAPPQQFRGVTAYNWYTQISRATMDISGTAMNTDVKPAVMADGTVLDGWTSVLTRDAEALCLRRMYNTFLFGDITDTAQANLNVSLSTTQGFDSVVQARGQQLNVGATAVTMANLLSMTSLMKSQDASTFYQMWVANKRRNEIDTLLQSSLANSLNPLTDKVFEKLFFGSESNHDALRTTYTWQSITLSGINLAISEVNFLNNPTTYNVNSSTSMFQNLIYFLPVGETRVTLQNGTTINSDYVSILKRRDKWISMEPRGMASNGSNDGIDQNVMDILTDWGARWVQANAFMRIY